MAAGIKTIHDNYIVSSHSTPHSYKSFQPSLERSKQGTAQKPKPTANTVWNSAYSGMSIEEVKRVNPFAVPSWLDEPFGVDGSRERRDGIKKLFLRKTAVGNGRIRELNRNDGKYVAFRAIVHGYAIWEDGTLPRSNKPIQ